MVFWGWVLFLTCGFSSMAHGSEPLRIAYPEFIPFHYTDDHGKIRGFFYDILEEALRNRMNIQLEWSSYPWARCQENVRNGKEDAFITVPTAERKEYTTTHEKPFYRKPLHIFTYAGQPRQAEILKIREIDDLRKYDFSVITYSGNGWHEKNVKSLGIKTYESSSLENIWHMLALKRGDIVIEWPVAALPDINRLQLGDKVYDTKNVLASMPFHLMIRKGSKFDASLNEFEATIAAMKRDGTMKAILKRYSAEE